jgi:hypothetical protein
MADHPLPSGSSCVYATQRADTLVSSVPGRSHARPRPNNGSRASIAGSGKLGRRRVRLIATTIKERSYRRRRFLKPATPAASERSEAPKARRPAATKIYFDPLAAFSKSRAFSDTWAPASETWICFWQICLEHAAWQGWNQASNRALSRQGRNVEYEDADPPVGCASVCDPVRVPQPARSARGQIDRSVAEAKCSTKGYPLAARARRIAGLLPDRGAKGRCAPGSFGLVLPCQRA